MDILAGRATRTTMIVAIFLVFVMLGIPSFVPSNHGSSQGAVGNASAAIADRDFTMGWIDFLGDIGTLNPFVYTMTAEYIVFTSVYSTLLMNDLDDPNSFIGDLAYNYSVLPDGLTWRFDISPNAYWCDPAAPNDKSHPVTYKDIEWTFYECQNNTANIFHAYFPGVIDSIWPVDSSHLRSFYIKLKYAFSPFESALTTVPVLPEYYWKTVGNVYSFNGVKMIGSGPFYYAGSKLPTTECRLVRNPTWFQEVDRGWQVHEGTFVIRNEADATTAEIELKADIIDVMTTVPPSIYLKDIASGNTSDVFGFGVDEGFVYEFNMNQMTDALRTQMHMSGSNNQILLDPVVKQAMQMCVNKPAFVSEVLLGLGAPGDSLVPRLNPWHYAYGVQPSEGGRAPVGEELLPFDPTAARALLNAAGWNFDSNGNPATLTTIPLYKKDPVTGAGIDPLSFKMYSLLPEPEWKIGTEMITADMATAGVLLHGKLRESDPPDYFSVNVMNGYWKTANYDCWLWDWYMSNVGDPSTDIMSVLTSMEIPTYTSDVYWSNPTYDSIYNLSVRAADPRARMMFTDALQRMAYLDSGCDAVAYRQELFALSTKTWEHYGNWEKNWLLCVDFALPWLHTRLWAADNNAPEISVTSAPLFDVGVASSISSVANDDLSAMEVKYFWGDGTVGPWVNYATDGGGTQSHSYAKDGVYTVYVAAREVGSADGFQGWNRTKVTVQNLNNHAPTGVDIVLNPSTDLDTGTRVSISGVATDPEGDQMTYVWDFGDLNLSYGQSVTHQWLQDGSFDLKLSVTDNHIGSGTRPVPAAKYVSIIKNSPPSLSVDSRTGVYAKQTTTFYAVGSDVNVRDNLQYTWDWGDGTVSVTTVNQSVHQYARAKVFTLSVSLDDQTGLPLHNVTRTAQVEVITIGNNAPQIGTFGVSKNTPYTGEIVTFTGTAKDQNKDVMDFTFDFGDGMKTFVPNVGGGDTSYHSVTVSHSYATSGSKTAYLFVSDGQANTTSVPGVSVLVIANGAPIVDPLTDVYSATNVAIDFLAVAFDPEMDSMSYWWNFGDGTPLVSGESVQHKYTASGNYLYSVSVNDGIVGHNTTVSAYVYSNWIPWILSPLPNLDSTCLMVTFSVTAWDNDTLDNTSLQFTWTFGDGETMVVWGNTNDPNPTVTHTFVAAGTYGYSVHVYDQFAETTGGSHNVSKSASVLVHEGVFTLNLVVGWNFVCVPLVGHGYMASTLGLLTGDTISGWDTASGVYSDYVVGYPYPDFPIVANTGYWIYVNAPETLDVHGFLPYGSQSRTIVVTAGDGWAIVGFEGTNTGRHASDIAAMYSNPAAVDVVTAYDVGTGNYVDYVYGYPYPDYALVPGQAYWVHFTASGELAYIP